MRDYTFPPGHKQNLCECVRVIDEPFERVDFTGLLKNRKDQIWSKTHWIGLHNAGG